MLRFDPSQPRSFWLVVTTAALLSLSARLLLLPGAHLAEIDSALRIFTAVGWWAELDWPAHDAWLPLHRMLLGAWIALLPVDRLSAALGFAAACHAGLVVAVAWAARALEPRYWWLAMLGVVLGPLYFAQSFNPLAELPATVLVVTAVGLLLRAEQQGRPALLLLGLGCLIGAEMLRYEVWLVAVLIWLVPSDRRWRVLSALLLAAFPLLWMGGHLSIHGDLLYGLHVAARWQQEQGHGSPAGALELLQRLGFAVTAMLGGGLLPIALLGAVGAMAGLLKRDLRIICLITLVILSAGLWGAGSGQALLRSRYLLLPATLLLLCAPLAVPLLQHMLRAISAKSRHVLVVAVSLTSLLVGLATYLLVVPEALVPHADPRLREQIEQLAALHASDDAAVFYSVPHAQAFSLALGLPGDIARHVFLLEPGDLHPCMAALISHQHAQVDLLLGPGVDENAALGRFGAGAKFKLALRQPVGAQMLLLQLHSVAARPDLLGACRMHPSSP